MKKARKPYRPPRRAVKFQLRLSIQEYEAMVAKASAGSKTLAAYLREKALS